MDPMTDPAPPNGGRDPHDVVRVAAVQMASTEDVDRNLGDAAAALAEAAGRGARVAVLPELFSCNGSGAALIASAEPVLPVPGRVGSWARDQARDLGLWLVAGTFIEAHADGSRTNTALVVAPNGAVVASYRKIHLFDCAVPGAEYHESSITRPGDEIVVVPLPGESDPSGGAPPITLGMSICYDLRFPELYRILAVAGATVVVVPAAFTARTGVAHWEVLLRARAVENQCFVVAAGQAGAPAGAMAWHGHSMVVDPWGRVLSEAGGEAPEVITADLDLHELRRVRSVLPSLASRREGTYDWSLRPPGA